MIRRREFITLLGGARWPLSARAEQAERMRRVGVLMSTAADEPEGQRPGSPRLGKGIAAIGLERRPQPADRHSLEREQCRPHSDPAPASSRKEECRRAHCENMASQGEPK